MRRIDAGVALGFNPHRISQIRTRRCSGPSDAARAPGAAPRRGRRTRALALDVLRPWVSGKRCRTPYFLCSSIAACAVSARFLASVVIWRGWARSWRPGGGALALLPVIIPVLSPETSDSGGGTHGQTRSGHSERRCFGAHFPARRSCRHQPFSRLCGNSEQQLFPGVTVLALIIVRGRPRPRAWFRNREPWPRPRLTAVLALIAVGAVAVAMAAPVVGPWHLDIGRLRIVSVTTATKPLTVALRCGNPCHGHRRARGPRGRLFAFYVLAAAVMYAFSFGPERRCCSACRSGTGRPTRG